ncbi:notch homolog 2 N-terminal-like protein A [Lytechinus pictus]|uniref:notch homolog 2 N-terminal-like protein A n=1 Tax=Lytechinus pictus TaxID=7653 RepID=UPI0030BA0822
MRQGLAVTDCISSPCENGATCVPLPGGYECNCLTEYYGDRCENLNPCLKFDYCADRGNCSSIQGSTWDCDCFSGYVGYKCKHIDSCASGPCPEGTTCQNVWPSSYRCICEQHGYYGAECDNFNACSSSPCLNGGKCLHISSQEYNCDCNPDGDVTGYYGQNCENFDPCLPEPCDEFGGTCRNISDTDYFCECFLGFHGNFCSSFDVCMTSPCLNDGVCESYNNGTNYTCHCPPIYRGSHCERLRQCLGDVTVDIKGIISWPDIDVGTNTSSQCASGGNNVTRHCYFEETKNAARWTFPDTSECEKANLTNEVAATMTSYLRDSTGSNPAEMGDSEVSSASELLDAVVEFSYEQQEMAGNMMECVSNLLEVEDHVLESSARNSGADTR